MSQAYVIRVSESVRRQVVVVDAAHTQLELLDLLPREATRALLVQELTRRGFTVEPRLARRRDTDDLAVEIDLDTGAVTITLAEERVLLATAERARSVSEQSSEAHRASARARLADEARAQAAHDARTQESNARREITARLEAKLGELQRELDQIENRTNAEALKMRAAQLGEIEDVSEDPATGSLTIRIRT